LTSVSRYLSRPELFKQKAEKAVREGDKRSCAMNFLQPEKRRQEKLNKTLLS
jgi:hypothetical protein